MRLEHYIFIVVVLLIVFAIGYEKYSVMTCTDKSVEKLQETWDELTTLSDANQYYDIGYRSCMGRRGFER